MVHVLFTIAQFAQDGKRNLGVVEGNGAAGEDLLLLVALAGDENDVAWFGGWSARRMAAARSTSTVYSTPVDCRPGSISARIAAGSSERGLSLVATTKSLPSPAAWPILGRLVRSRSPPQPKSVITRAPVCRGHLARQRSQIAQRIVGVRVVHDHA